MTDYLGVALTGFSTGMGVIFAQEVYAWLKRNRFHRIPLEMAEDIIDDIKKDQGTRHRRR